MGKEVREQEKKITCNGTLAQSVELRRSEIRGDKDRILVDNRDAGYGLPHLDKWGGTYTKPEDLTGNNPVVKTMDAVVESFYESELFPKEKT